MGKDLDHQSMAVFCDFENVALGVRDARFAQFDISKVLERLLLKGSIVVKKAYCDWERYKEFKAAMHEAAFELIEIPLPGQTYETGTVARILYVTRAPDNTVLLVAHGLKRFRISEWISGKKFLKAKIMLAPETIESDIETDALYRNLRDLTQEIFALSLDASQEAIDELRRVKDKLYLTYIAAGHSEIDFETRQSLLEEDSLKAKLRKLLKILRCILAL